jgi:hypothetical protein
VTCTTVQTSSRWSKTAHGSGDLGRPQVPYQPQPSWSRGFGDDDGRARKPLPWPPGRWKIDRTRGKGHTARPHAFAGYAAALCLDPSDRCAFGGRGPTSSRFWAMAARDDSSAAVCTASRREPDRGRHTLPRVGNSLQYRNTPPTQCDTARPLLLGLPGLPVLTLSGLVNEVVYDSDTVSKVQLRLLIFIKNIC